MSCIGLYFQDIGMILYICRKKLKKKVRRGRESERGLEMDTVAGEEGKKKKEDKSDKKSKTQT